MGRLRKVLMIILAIETATSRQNLAVFEDQTLLGYGECESDRSLTPQLIPAIHQLLEKISLDAGKLEGLAVSIGPGTFTGLRVGLATMTGFRLALGIPLVGVSTLEGLAWNLPQADLPIVCSVAIRPGMVYWGLFRWQDEGLMCLKSEQVGSVSEMCATISEPTIVLGDGWLRNKESLEQSNCFIMEGPAEAMWPSAKGIGLAGQVLLEQGKCLPEGCSPKYIQPSYAEISKPLSSLQNLSK